MYDMRLDAATTRSPCAANGMLLEPLSRRELQVLHVLATGAHNKEIGRALGISEKTAGLHVRAIMGKLAVNSRGEAVAAAAHLGLVSL